MVFDHSYWTLKHSEKHSGTAQCCHRYHFYLTLLYIELFYPFLVHFKGFISWRLAALVLYFHIPSAEASCFWGSTFLCTNASFLVRPASFSGAPQCPPPLPMVMVAPILMGGIMISICKRISRQKAARLYDKWDHQYRHSTCCFVCFHCDAVVLVSNICE